MGQIQRTELFQQMIRYNGINNSPWFKELAAKAYRNSQRSGNRIYVYFKSEKEAEQCIELANKRNINTAGIMHDCYREDFRVDIMMNWKLEQPTRIKRNLPLVLD